jgi:hypothetical protein
MSLKDKISRQRVKYIVSSYQLEGRDRPQVDLLLKELLDHYPMPLIELALVETLVDQWLSVPPVRGMEFFSRAQKKLKTWETKPIISTITPAQFRQITALDPSPVFGTTDLPPPRRIVHPS